MNYKNSHYWIEGTNIDFIIQGLDSNSIEIYHALQKYAKQNKLNDPLAEPCDEELKRPYYQVGIKGVRNYAVILKTEDANFLSVKQFFDTIFGESNVRFDRP